MRRPPSLLSLRRLEAVAARGASPAATGVGAVAPTRGSSPALELEGVVKRYGPRTVVDGLSLRLERGRVLALLGPNGAGKTTTVELCIGFRRPEAGSVRVLGLDPVVQGDDLRPRIGVMLQSGGVYQAARCAEMLRLVASYAADPIDPDLLLSRLGLEVVADTPYRRLSGGQQQRLSLAMAVVGRPELVFLDEPTAGLDPQARQETWRIVEALRRDGVSVVLTTHHMDEAERLADEVAIVDAGRVLATGTPEELVRGGAAPDEVRLTAPPGLDLEALGRVLPAGCGIRVAGPGARTSTGPTGYVVTGPITPELPAAITAWCAARGVLVEGLQVHHRSLEDVFLDLTGRELRP